MYGPPGTVYVYLSYGCHHLLNLVCCEEGIAGAVLIRAIEPREGIPLMRRRRGRGSELEQLCNGPGKLSAALGIDLTDNATVLSQGRVSVYDGVTVPEGAIGVSGRVGLSQGHELDLRYFLQGSRFVSRGRLGPVGGKGRRSEGGRG
jgi:DNA-3-methyladenine glycosylase